MSLKEAEIKALEERARKARIKILKMLTKARSGHTGGSLSIVEIMVAIYFHLSKITPENWDDPTRDRCVLSKGHAVPALYAILSELGFIDDDCLYTLREIHSCLQGHPCIRSLPKGVEMSTGSLGQGLSIANGMALSARLDGINNRIFVLLGDGECQEGQVWEAAMTSAHYNLSNIIAFVDFNGLQIDGEVRKVKNIEPLRQKWESFGWFVQEINGHHFPQIIYAVEKTKFADRPSMIIAHTVKGKGVSLFENKFEYHGISPTPLEMVLALIELKEESGEISKALQRVAPTFKEILSDFKRLWKGNPAMEKSMKSSNISYDYLLELFRSAKPEGDKVQQEIISLKEDKEIFNRILKEFQYDYNLV